MSAPPDLFTASQHLAAFIAESTWDAIPQPVRHEGRRSLLNFIGGAIGVARTPPIDAALRVLMPLSGADRVTLLGRAERLDMLNATFLNAIAANLLDYDDTHLRTVIHPSAPVAPVVLALAEQRGLSGQEALHAFILGVEAECRIGNAVSPGHYARGWHITATCGVFGAAAAAARLLRLDAAQTAHALGIAASQSAGLVENLPYAAKNASVGNAARNGFLSALLAEQGYEAAPASLEGVFGWARAMGDAPDVAEIAEGLGTRWEALRNTYKPYPCGIVMHAVIDACLALRQQHGITAENLAAVTISGDQLLLDRGDRIVRNDRDSRVSIHHCAAVSLLRGRAGLAEFSAAAVRDPEVVRLRGLVTAALDPASPRGAARAEARTRDGRSVAVVVRHAKGSTEAPLSDAEIEAKVRDLARFAGFRGTIDAVIAAAWQVDGLPRIDRLLNAAAES